VVGVADTGTAVFMQEQTARAEDETWSPVTAPQALTMQSKAALWMTEACEVLHRQAKSCSEQPAREAADDIQETCKGRLA
jgi:hypothetical protein